MRINNGGFSNFQSGLNNPAPAFNSAMRLANNPPVSGGFTPYRPLDPGTRQIFQQATKGLRGASYQPMAVSTQVANGINYKFVATQRPWGFPNQAREVVVQIHNPIIGAPYVTSITNFPQPNCGSRPPGW